MFVRGGIVTLNVCVIFVRGTVANMKCVEVSCGCTTSIVKWCSKCIVFESVSFSVKALLCIFVCLSSLSSGTRVFIFLQGGGEGVLLVVPGRALQGW